MQKNTRTQTTDTRHGDGLTHIGWVDRIRICIWLGQKTKFDWVLLNGLTLLFYFIMTSQKIQVELDDHVPPAKNSSQQITTDAPHVIQLGVLSLEQTCYRGCKSDCNENTSCHKTTCSLCNNLLYSTVQSLICIGLRSMSNRQLGLRPVSQPVVCTRDTKSSFCSLQWVLLHVWQRLFGSHLVLLQLSSFYSDNITTEYLPKPNARSNLKRWLFASLQAGIRPNSTTRTYVSHIIVTFSDFILPYKG